MTTLDTPEPTEERHDYRRARGVSPMQPGDPLPEEAIRRMRDAEYDPESPNDCHEHKSTTPCLACFEGGHSARIIPARSDHPAPEPTCATCGDAIAWSGSVDERWRHVSRHVRNPVHVATSTEAPAPAAPLSEAAQSTTGASSIMDEFSTREPLAPAAPSALEEARTELIVEMEGCVTTYLADQDGHDSCDGCLGALDHLLDIAAVRAPGPVGGEA